MKEKKKVAKERFLEFIENYPTELEKDVYAVYSPPLITYNDFSLGKWPQSVVAHFIAETRDEDIEYFINEN